MIVAPKGKLLVSLDLSQAEMWIVAYLAKEETMKKFLKEGDIHTETASFLENVPKAQVTPTLRYTGKRCNHALDYRMSYMRLVQVVNKESDKPPYLVISNPQGKRYFDKWHQLYNLKNWWAQIEYDLGQNARTLVTPYGRVRTFFAQWGQELFKEATAYVPQSTVADHLNGMVQPEIGIEGGLLTVYRKFVKERRVLSIVNQSHDSFICEIDKELVDELCPQLVQLIKRPLVINQEQFTIPVDCEVGERWGELEKRKVA
jgi:DNA polymerase I-like protein with 3'-5' exonuclease and polymerase domains